MAKPAWRRHSNSGLFSFTSAMRFCARRSPASIARRSISGSQPSLPPSAPGAIYKIQACSSPGRWRSWPKVALWLPSARQINVGAPAMGIRYEISACWSGWLPCVRPVSESKQTPRSARVLTRPTSRQSNARIILSGFRRQDHLAAALDQAADGVTEAFHFADGAAAQRGLAGLVQRQHLLAAEIFQV